MATAEQCRAALESLTGRIAQMDAKERAAHLANRTLSCQVTDLGITFMTKLGADGAGPVTQVPDGAPAAQIRFAAKSDEVLAVAADPGSFARAWLTGKLKVEGNMLDLLRLRKLL
jgi:predicted lipid carrier protein YhbT